MCVCVCVCVCELQCSFSLFWRLLSVSVSQMCCFDDLDRCEVGWSGVLQDTPLLGLAWHVSHDETEVMDFGKGQHWVYAVSTWFMTIDFSLDRPAEVSVLGFSSAKYSFSFLSLFILWKVVAARPHFRRWALGSIRLRVGIPSVWQEKGSCTSGPRGHS